MNAVRFASLFSGIGGFDLGLERAGMECAVQVELDEHCVRVLARHWPLVLRHGDIRRAGGADILPGVDLFAGGFPCQDVSVAGRRAGLAGERSGLFFEFARLAAALRPRWLVVENVPGLLSSNGGRDMGAIVRTLGELGYGLAWRVLDAQYFGVAQRRRRLFVVGCLGDASAAAQVLFEPESCGGNPAPRHRAAEDAAGSLGSQPAGGGWRSDTDRMMFVANTLLGGPTGERGPGHGARSGDAKDRALIAMPLLGHHGHHIDAETETFVTEDGTGRGTPLVAVAEPLDASYAKSTDSAGSNGAGPRNVVLGTLRSNYRNNSDPTTEAAMHIQSGMSVRRLTPTECERLQGFPDGWTALGATVDPAGIIVRQCHIAQLLSAELRAAADPVLTGHATSAFCTTSASASTALLISRLDAIDLATRARSAVVLSASTEPAAGAPAATSPGGATAIRERCGDEFKHGGRRASPTLKEQTSGPSTYRSLRLSSAGLSSLAKSCITSTWTSRTTTQAISGSTALAASTTPPTIHWSEQRPPSSSEVFFALRVVDITPLSDSARYRALGNAVAVPVAEWIGRRITAAHQAAQVAESLR